MSKMKSILPLLMYGLAAFGHSKSREPGDWCAGRQPTGKELRNPDDPHQAARIRAAAEKRARKAAKLTGNSTNG